MGRDFYKILGVTRNADDKEIKKAYKKQSIKWHPDKNPNDKENAEKKFKDIAAAYQVLSDPQKRKTFDQFGEDGLKMGGGGGSGGGFGGEGFQGVDPFEIFRSMFGGAGAGDAGFGMGGMPGGFSRGGSFPGGMGGGFGGMPGGGGFHQQQQQNHTQAGAGEVTVTTHPLPCSLEELYNGKKKKMKVNRRDQHGQTTSKVLEIDVRPGWKAGTKITFASEGDTNRYGTKGTVQFVVEEKVHSTFERQGKNLIVHVPVTLKQAIMGGQFTVPHIDGRRRNINLGAHYIQGGKKHVMKGLGMPSKTGKGDLIVYFDIKLDMTPEQANQICRILDSNLY